MASAFGCFARLHFFFFVESSLDCGPSQRWDDHLLALDPDETGSAVRVILPGAMNAWEFGWEIACWLHRRSQRSLEARRVYFRRRHCGVIRMIPYLHLGPLQLPTFGLMVALALITAAYVLQADFRPARDEMPSLHNDHVAGFLDTGR